MPSARLLQVNCPQCGAHLQFSADDEVVTCRYCGASSLVASLLPLVPQAQPAPPVNRGGVFVLAMAAFIMVGTIASGALVWMATSRPSPSPRPFPAPLPESPPPAVPPSQACEKAVVCCRAVMSATGTVPSNMRACEAMRALSDADCATQYTTFRSTAASLGKRCD
ncbi:MAG: hypothetical protein U0359_32720 [Byssovorax sp.]